MKLAIFDIDGTLTCTNAVDEACFLATAQLLISNKIKEIDPEGFKHYTDENILTEWYQQYLNRKPAFMDKDTFKSYLIQLMRGKKQQDLNLFKAVVGAAEVLHNLGPEWQLALATGCWAISAEFKLQAAGIDIKDIPIATSNEGISRQEIVATAIEKAKRKAMVSEFEKMVYIGDGLWDLRTCADLSLPFVGIEAVGDAHKRERLGEFCLLQDYSDLQQVKILLENAQVPVIE
jgi:phosphoglycolate phosphatase-like HAD superfamily hydrolase